MKPAPIIGAGFFMPGLAKEVLNEHDYETQIIDTQ